MTTSSKRKKEKAKDFKKAKLKVGKAKPKSENATDTSFKARALVLNQQSLNVVAPSKVSQFAHHVSQLNNRSDSQRQESLAFLTSAIMANGPKERLPQPVSVLLPKLQPLLLDSSRGVRQQLLKLLKALPKEDVRLQSSQLLLYTRAAMTHLSSDIKLSSIDVLEWLAAAAGPEIVTCPGGWVQTIASFVNLLGWNSGNPGSVQGWSSGYQPSARPGSSSKLYTRQINGLTAFVGAGLPADDRVGSSVSHPGTNFPLWSGDEHLLPQRSDPFAPLGLFESSEEKEDDAMLEDREDRQRVFVERFERPIDTGVENALKEGGELGRAASALRKVLIGALKDFDREGMAA